MNKTELAIRDQIESASLEDLMPDFDREGTWEKISVQLQQEQPAKKKILWWYMPAAAAIVLGIFIAYFFFNDNKEIVSQQTALVHTNIKPKASIVSADMPLQKADTVRTIAQHLKIKEVKQLSSAVLKDEPVAGNVPVQQSPIAEHITTTESDKLVPVAIAKPLPVKHFLDIDNEDQSIMKAGQQIIPRPSYKERIAQRMSKDRHPDPNALPLREIYYAISN